MTKKTILTFLLCWTACFSYSQTRETISVKLNIPLTSEIGEAVISQSDVNKIDALEIKETFEVPSIITKFRYNEGDVYPLVFIKKGFEIYYLKCNYKDGRYWGVGVNINNPEEVFPVLISSAHIVAKLKKYELNSKVKKTELVTICTDCLKKEFIYVGKINNIVKFEYREFIGNIARQSYYQNLEYDISENSIIGFKGLRLKILSTSNTSIIYEVLEAFSSIK